MVDKSMGLFELTEKREYCNQKGGRLFFYFVLTFLTFFYIYEFNLKVWGGPTFLTSRRICSAVFFIIWVLQNGFSKSIFVNRTTEKSIKQFTIVLLISFLYVCGILLVIGIGNGEIILIDIIELLLFGLFPALVTPGVFRTKDVFLKVLLATAIVQSIIIILCQFNGNFCDFIDAYFSTDYKYVASHRAEYAGGLACITAPGLLRFSTGFFACLYLLFSTKKIRYFLLFLMLSFVGTMVARTGLVLSLIGLVFIVLYSCFNGGSRLLVKLSVSVLMVFIMSYLALKNPIVQAFLGERFKRLYDLFMNGLESEFLGGYFGNGSGNILPNLNLATFFGTGMTSGIAGNGEQCLADGGYIRLYFAFGLIGVIAFYLSTFIILLSGVKRIKQSPSLYWSVLYLIIIIFVGEFKEYLLFTQYLLFIVFSVFLLEKCEKGCHK